MRPFPLFPLALAVVVSLGAQRPTVSKKAVRESDPRWVRVDSLSDQGQYDSALGLVEAIGADAKAKGDWRTEFRAWAVQGAYREVLGQPADSIIGLVKARIATTTPADLPLRQLLHSKLAGYYLSLIHI